MADMGRTASIDNPRPDPPATGQGGAEPMEEDFRPAGGDYVAEARVLPAEQERQPNVPVARPLSIPGDSRQEGRGWQAPGAGHAPEAYERMGGFAPTSEGYSGGMEEGSSVFGVARPLGYGQRGRHDHGEGALGGAPSRYDVLKTAVLQHCFGPDFHYLSRVPDVSEADVMDFVSSVDPPSFLTQQQRALLTELLTNMENWWGLSFESMQSIHDESSTVMGFGALPIPPSPLPLQIQRRLKTLVRSVMHLLSLPTAAATAVAKDNGCHPVEDVQYWKMLGQEHKHNPKMVLKEWLFQRFDKPYPTDQDKKLLAAVTGMTKTQVSNWFINARVRIWQPLVMELGRELAIEDGQPVDDSSDDGQLLEAGQGVPNPMDIQCSNEEDLLGGDSQNGVC
eukprot:evm.model.scf_55.4 EVM.evm.TU.scf_55.4   scf_55:100049-105805(+)